MNWQAFGVLALLASSITAHPARGQIITPVSQTRFVQANATLNGVPSSFNAVASDFSDFFQFGALLPFDRVRVSQYSILRPWLLRIDTFSHARTPDCCTPVSVFAESSGEFVFSLADTRTGRIRGNVRLSGDFCGPRAGSAIQRVELLAAGSTLYAQPVPPFNPLSCFVFGDRTFVHPVTLPAGTYTLRARTVARAGGTSSGATGEGATTTADIVLNFCEADWNDDAAVNSLDLSAYLGVWFNDLAGGTTNSEFDSDPGITSSDVSAFVTAWFAALAGACD